jgi:DNA polymerase
VKAKKDALMSKLNYEKADLMSNPKLAELLEFHGVIPPQKVSFTTGKMTYAFAKSDEAFKALLDHENPQVQAIVAARLGVKSTLEETRTERFIRIAERGTLPVPLRYYAAHTGRWGGDDKVNLQNLPRKSMLKKAMKAPEGYTFIDCDSSQIEARTLAWLAGQDDLVAAFDRGEDVYKIMASRIYNKPIEEVTDGERFVGKTTILGCLAEGTLVLTDRGWVVIEEVSTSDQLWDGEEWVCHQGLVQKGTKETLSLCGLWLTPDHKVLCGTQWLEAQSVVRDERTLSQALDTGAVSWLYPTTIEGTNLITSASSLEQTTTLTVEKSVSCRRNLMTYDITYAGPRNRYTVATDAGPIIVHNCGYGMGAAKFQAQLKNFGVELPLSECQFIIDVYRKTYPKITALWTQASRALQALMRQSVAPLGREGALQLDLLGIRLPNSMYIRYNNLRNEVSKITGREEIVYDVKKGRSVIPTRIYGGKVVENVCQALARIVIGEQMLMIARRYKVVMTVHDAVGVIAKQAEAGQARSFVEACMRIRPKWAAELPLNCESKMGASYGG